MIEVGVLDDYDGSIGRLGCWKKLPRGWKVEFLRAPAAPDALSGFEVIVANRERTVITRDVLAAMKDLQHLALTGRLSGQADLEALEEKGVAVSYTDGSGQAAAELTIALILCIAKNVAALHESVRAGGWQAGPATSLGGKTLGVLGLGRIGTQTARFGRLMGMDVVSWGPTENQERSEKLGIERVGLDDALRRADILAVCLRLSERTRGILGARELGLLKDGACLVNTARAEIADKDALYAQLASGRIKGAFDVFHNEPLPPDDPIRRFPNVLLSPHMGYVTREVYDVFFSQVVENLLAWKDGRAYKNALKPA